MTEPFHNDASCFRFDAESICIRIAGITIDLFSGSPEMRLCVESSTRKFAVHAIDPDVRVRASLDTIKKTHAEEKIFDSGALWKLYRDDENHLFRFSSPYYGGLPYKEASFNRDFTEGEIRLRRAFFKSDRVVYPLEYPLDELLMLSQLAQGKGVEVHASGVIDSTGKGYLFVGHSGAGKTTLTRLWQKREGAKVLSDDRIILRKVNDCIWMYGTPWHGEAEISCAGEARLSHIFFLRHGRKNELVFQKRAGAAARLFACGFPPFYSPSGIDFTLSFYDEVTKKIPCSELRFFPDDRVIDFIRRQT